MKLFHSLKAILPEVNKAGFARDFVANYCKRRLAELLSKVTEDQFRWMIRENQDALSFLPTEIIQSWKAQSSQYAKMASGFSDEEVYQWLPKTMRDVAEAEELGPAWIQRQTQDIRRFFFTS